MYHTRERENSQFSLKQTRVRFLVDLYKKHTVVIMNKQKICKLSIHACARSIF